MMDGSDKGASSIPPKSALLPKPSSFGANDENDTSLDHMNSKSQNVRKPMAKHFMSPTISAASKVAPRKKVLTERNENSSSSDIQILSNLEMKNNVTGQSGRSSTRSYSFASESDDENGECVASSSLKPYDPVMNYLSPRPKFLRYNPNRRFEILRRREQESGEEMDGLGLNSSDGSESQEVVKDKESASEAKDSCIHPVDESKMKQENGESTSKVEADTEDDDDEEKEVEERGGCLKGVLKFLLVLLCCFLSSSCLLSMNSLTPSPTQQAVSHVRDGFLMIQKHIFDASNLKMYAGGLSEVENRDLHDEVEIVDSVEDGDVDADDDDEVGLDSGHVGLEMVEDNNEVNMDGGSDEVELVPNDDEILEMEAADGNYEKDMESAELDKENDGDIMVAESEESEDASDHGKEFKIGDFNEFTMANKSDESGEPGYDVMEKEEKGSADLKESEVLKKIYSVKLDETHQNPEVMEAVETSETVFLANDPEQEGETWRVGSSIAGVLWLLAAIIVASGLFVYHSSAATKSPPEMDQPILRLHKPIIEHKEIVHVTTVEERAEKRLEFSASPLSSRLSIENATRELSQHYTHSPSIKLIGEFVVGEVSSSMKSGGMKSQMNDSHNSIAALFQKQQSDSRPVSAATQPPAAELCAADSPSYGSFTAEKKILKKEQFDLREPKREQRRLKSLQSGVQTDSATASCLHEKQAAKDREAKIQ